MPHPSMWLPFLCQFVTAFVVTLVTTPLARAIAWRVDAVDYPNKRRVNKEPIPRMGGIAVVAGIAASVLVEMYGARNLGWLNVAQPTFLSVDYRMLTYSFSYNQIVDCSILMISTKLYRLSFQTKIEILSCLKLYLHL